MREEGLSEAWSDLDDGAMIVAGLRKQRLPGRGRVRARFREGRGLGGEGSYLCPDHG